LIALWERSVRATHHFLPEEDIERFKPLIVEHFFPSVQLFGMVDEQGRILGFCGVSGDKLEMLFVAPDFLGKGIGKLLLQHAIHVMGIRFVDVNEQNPSAVGFYLYQGFRVDSRDELDEQGNPYPILHLSLAGEPYAEK
jgi:putative acetyltransferase